MKTFKIVLFIIFLVLLAVFSIQNQEYFLANTALHIDFKIPSMNYTAMGLPNWAYWLLCLVLGGFFVNFPWGVMQAFPSLRYPKEVVGRAMGITNGVGQFGSFVSPLLAGYLVVVMPDDSYDFGNVFLFWSILAFIAAGIACCLKEKQLVNP